MNYINSAGREIDYDNKLVEFFNKNRNLKLLNSKGYITNPNVEIGEQ